MAKGGGNSSFYKDAAEASTELQHPGVKHKRRRITSSDAGHQAEGQMCKSSLSSSCNERLLCRKATTSTPTSAVIKLAR